MMHSAHFLLKRGGGWGVNPLWAPPATDSHAGRGSRWAQASGGQEEGKLLQREKWLPKMETLPPKKKKLYIYMVELWHDDGQSSFLT